jgi:hypothetical protein
MSCIFHGPPGTPGPTHGQSVKDVSPTLIRGGESGRRRDEREEKRGTVEKEVAPFFKTEHTEFPLLVRSSPQTILNSMALRAPLDLQTLKGDMIRLAVQSTNVMNTHLLKQGGGQVLNHLAVAVVVNNTNKRCNQYKNNKEFMTL